MSCAAPFGIQCSSGRSSPNNSRQWRRNHWRSDFATQVQSTPALSFSRLHCCRRQPLTVTKMIPRSKLTPLVCLAVMFSALVYAVHFFLGSGSDHRILDSWAYLQIANGEQVSVPFNTRIVTPFLARLIA